MSAFSVLLVGHLIADFPFQTPTILRWKYRGGLWILPHVVIHAAVMGLLFKDLFVVSVIFVTHLLIDWVKVSYDDGSREGTSFLMDQSAHVLVLLVVAQFTAAAAPEITIGNVPVILMLAVISGVFMFLNVVKSQLAHGPLPRIVPMYAFHISKVSGWAAVIGLLVSVFLLH